MKNNPSALIGLYGSNEDFQHTVRDVLRLKDDVDGAVLNKAVNTAIKRYPYLAVKLVKNKNEIIHTVVPNDSPIVVAHAAEPYRLLSEETNGHMLAVLYQGKEIYFDLSHAFMDGVSLCTFEMTVLYYYITEKYGAEIPSGNIRTLDTPIDGEEVIDPYLHLPPLTEKPTGGVRRATPCFTLSEGGLITDRKHTIYKIKVKEDSFIKYSRGNDGSPAATSAAFLAKAIFRLHGNLDKSVRIGLPINHRPVLAAPKAHHCLVGNIRLDYPEKVRDWDMYKLGTVTRSMVMLQSDPGNVLAELHGMKKHIDSLYSIGDLETLKARCNKTYASAGRYVTAVVSYVGKLDYGPMAGYLEAHYSCIDPAYMNIAVEIQAVNGYFCYAFMQSFSNDAYVNAFAEELRNEEIEVELGEAEPLMIPRINI